MSTEYATATEAYIRYLDGDEEALGAIVRQYSDALLYFTCTFVHDIQTAEEIVADAFVHIAVKKHAFRQESGLKTYLFTIARHRAVDYVRKAARRGIALTEDAETLADTQTLEATVLTSERDRRLRAALSTLHGDYQTVLHLVYFEGLTAAEAATVMHKNKKQVDNLLYRAKAALKSILERDGYDYENL